MLNEYTHNCVCSQALRKYKSPTSKAKREPRGWEGQIRIPDYFVSPLSDNTDNIQSAFEGRVYDGLTLVMHDRKLEAYEVPILWTW